MRTLLSVSFLVILLTGCAKSGDTTAKATLFKTYSTTSVQGPNQELGTLHLTFTLVSANQGAANWVFRANGANTDLLNCTCDIALTGSETAGTYAFSNCAPNSDCSTLNTLAGSFSCDVQTLHLGPDVLTAQ